MKRIIKQRTLALPVLLALSAGLLSPKPASAGADPLLGEIMWTAASFCPRGYADASGQLLSIAQNTALFSLLGTSYGGDGRTTFGLPDLRGRNAIGVGQGPGLSNVQQGQRGGAETVTLTANQMPAHNHAATLHATDQAGNSDSPVDAVQAYKNRSQIYNNALSANANMDTTSITVANSGGNQAHENRSPYLGVRACVALVGIFPSRN